MLVGQAVRMASKGLVVLLLTRVFLTPDEYGLLFFAISVLGFGTLFANLGLAKSAGRYLTEYSETDPGQIPHVLRITLQYNLGTIAVVGVVLFVFADAIADLLGEPTLAPFLIVGVLYVAAFSLKKFTGLVFQGLGRVTYSAATGVLGNVAILVFVSGFLLLGAGAIGALYGYIVGYAIAALAAFGLLYTRYYTAYDAPPTPEEGLARRILEYSIPLTATRGANLLDSRVDTILVGVFLNPTAVGFYTLGKQISGFAIAPANSLGFSAAPAYGEHKAADDLDRAAHLYETTFEYTLALYLPAAVGLLLVADPLVRVVFGQDYLGAVPVLQLFSFYVVLRAIDKITSDSLDFLGRARYRAYAKGGTSVANFLLNLVAIPAFGVAGAAGATVLTHSVMIGIELYLVYRDLPVSVPDMARTVAVIGAVAAGVGLVVLPLIRFADGVLTLAAVVIAGGTVWLGLSMLSGLIDIADIRTTIG